MKLVPPTVKFIAITTGIVLLLSLSLNAAQADDQTDSGELAKVFEKSDRLCGEKKFDEAIDLLQASLKSSAEADVHERIARVYYLSGKTEDAIAELKLAISVDPNTFSYYSEMAWLYSTLGNHTESVRYANQALRLKNDDAYPYTILGFSLGSLGKKQQAMIALKQAIALAPTDFLPRLYLADVLTASGDYNGAMKKYQEALKLNPSAAAAYVGLGTCYQRTGNRDEAIKAYKTAVELSPQDANARGHLGFALSQAGDYSGAFRHGMVANSIRISQSWNTFMGMFVSVWAGIFIVFGAIFAAVFLGSRFKPQAGETVIGQFVLVFYRDRPGRFVVTDRRIVFVPELISQSLGTTRVSIEREQVSSIVSTNKLSAGILTVTSTSNTVHAYRMPLVVLSSAISLLKDNGFPVDQASGDGSEETPAKPPDKTETTAATKPATAIEDADEITAYGAMADDDEELVTAVSYDFRQSSEHNQAYIPADQTVTEGTAGGGSDKGEKKPGKAGKSPGKDSKSPAASKDKKSAENKKTADKKDSPKQPEK